jgi:hypothetical protein
MQGWGTLVVSGRTQKGRVEDLEWSSVTVVSSWLQKSHVGVQTDLTKNENEKESS